MKKANLFLIPALATTALAVDYNITSGDANVASNWSPNASSIISGTTITPLAGDRLLYNFSFNSNQITNPGATIVINSGAQIVSQGTTAGGQDGNNRAIRPQLHLAGTGTDGQGAFKAVGSGGWTQVSNVSLTGNATIGLYGGGWRHDNHGTGSNNLNLNGHTLTILGNQGVWLVNTVVTGPGIIDAQNVFADNINFEGSSVLPANVTLKLANNTRHSSWDGNNRVMAGNIEAAGGSIIEVRFNDLQKTYNGQITLGAGSVAFRTQDNGGGGGSIVVNGKVTGAGEFLKDGGASVDLGTTRGMVFLNNPNNDYTGGTRINSGVLKIGAQGALPAGKLTVNNGTLDLNGTTAIMTEGLIKANVSGAGSTLAIAGPGVTEIRAGAAVSVPVELSGGTLTPNYDGGNNILGNALTSTLVVTGDATLKPYQTAPTPAQMGLVEWHRVGPDATNDIGTTGATFLGIKQGIPGIDSTAKPFGDNNKWIYTGFIRNTTSSPINVSFAENYDDQIRVKVNGNTVLLDTGWNTPTQSGSVTLNPGDNPVEFVSFDGVGGAGPVGGWTKGIGIALGVPGLSNENYSVISNSGTMPAGLELWAPPIDNTADRTENKNIEIDGGVTLTVDTTDLHGKTYTLSGVLSGAGNLTKTGPNDLVISGVSTNTGMIMVQQGTLRVAPTGSIASSGVVNVAAGATLDASATGYTVPIGQTLDGNGTVNANTTVNGTISPGNSIGTLNITGSLTINGTYDAEASANGVNDLINASGGVTWGAGATFKLTLLGGYSPSFGDSFDFLNTSVSGTQPTFNLPALPGTLTWDTSQFMTSGILSVIPEPTTALLGLLSLGFLFRRRR